MRHNIVFQILQKLRAVAYVHFVSVEYAGFLALLRLFFSCPNDQSTVCCDTLMLCCTSCAKALFAWRVYDIGHLIAWPHFCILLSFIKGNKGCGDEMSAAM
jgi:hypothetical protein